MINTPQEDQVTLENLKTHLTNLRNNITLNEAELQRLSKLAESEKYTVAELYKQRKSIEDEIAKIAYTNQDKQTELDDLLKQITSKQTELETQDDRIADANASYEQIIEDIEGKQQEIKQAQKTLDALILKQQGIKDELGKLAERENEIVKKEEKFKLLAEYILNTLK